MAYSELIKNFENIRDYISQFYVYGFKRRKDYDKKSSRSQLHRSCCTIKAISTILQLPRHKAQLP